MQGGPELEPSLPGSDAPGMGGCCQLVPSAVHIRSAASIAHLATGPSAQGRAVSDQLLRRCRIPSGDHGPSSRAKGGWRKVLAVQPIRSLSWPEHCGPAPLPGDWRALWSAGSGLHRRTVLPGWLPVWRQTASQGPHQMPLRLLRCRTEARAAELIVAMLVEQPWRWAIRGTCGSTAGHERSVVGGLQCRAAFGRSRCSTVGGAGVDPLSAMAVVAGREPGGCLFEVFWTVLELSGPRWARQSRCPAAGP